MKNKTPTYRDYFNWCGPRRKAGLIGLNRDEWIDYWKDSSQWDLRGNSNGSVRMCRKDREKPFTLDNIQLRVVGRANRSGSLTTAT